MMRLKRGFILARLSKERGKSQAEPYFCEEHAVMHQSSLMSSLSPAPDSISRLFRSPHAGTETHEKAKARLLYSDLFGLMFAEKLYWALPSGLSLLAIVVV